MTGEVGSYSLSDIAAIMHNRDGDGFLEGNGIVILILFFLIFGMNGAWGANGWSGNGFANGALTRAEMYDGFNNQTVVRKLDGINSGLCDGFYAQNTTMLTGFNTIGREIAENRFAAQNCCCSLERNIDSVRSDNYKNTCEITSAIHAEGEATRALINANTMQNLRDKLADRDRDLQTANFQLSQQAQNATLINELRPCAKPAYLTCSPYQSSGYGFGNGWGYGCVCGGY